MKPEALDRFLQAHERQAFGIARAATGNTDDALDLVQDAMFKLVRAYADREESDLKPLFYRILNNTIMDYYRRNRSKSKLMVEWDKEEPADVSSPSPIGDGQQLLLQSRQMDALQQALAQLPGRQQEAFMLRCWEGFDTATTAATMGCSEGSVKTHYSRALNSLRQALGDLWP